MFTIGIDTGGTFTDAFVTGGDRFATVKVETTPHDLTVCFADAITASSEALGLERDEFLRRADVIRFSSTIATNTVLTGTGPKLGLLVTRSAEEDLYGATGDGELLKFVRRDMIAGLEESVSPDGEVLLAPAIEEINAAVRLLLERGARLLVVSLRNAATNPANEHAVKAAVDSSYPRHYLGAVPVLLSTQISLTNDDAARTASAVVNAYMHKKLATSLYRAEDDLRRDGFRRPLLVVNTDGGVTRVAKTRALATYQSGPTSGIYGSARLCNASGVRASLTADVGGTSTDVGLIVGSSPLLRDRVDVGGVPVLQRSVELVSFGIGGGSLARVVDDQLHVGPESAGAAPGPACFGLGGREPTPTDAWLVLGYLDPSYYLGGRKRLDLDRAAEAIRDRVAKPLGLGLEEAALAIKEVAEESVAAGVEAALTRDAVRDDLTGVAPSDLALVAYGGGGGILMPGVAQRLGIGRVLLSRFSPVFSAFGVSSFPVRHAYEGRARLNGAGPAAVIDELVTRAHADMRGEGFDESAVELAVTVRRSDGRTIVAEAPLAALASADLPSGEDLIFLVSATCVVVEAPLPEQETHVGGVEPKGTRRVVLPDGEHYAPVYTREALGAGARVIGPALIEATDTTYLVPAGSACTIDRLGTAELTEES